MSMELIYVYLAVAVVTLVIFTVIEKVTVGAVYLGRLVGFAVIAAIPVINLMALIFTLSVAFANWFSNMLSKKSKEPWTQWRVW